MAKIGRPVTPEHYKRLMRFATVKRQLEEIAAEQSSKTAQEAILAALKEFEARVTA